ncbi:MAG: response regulator [Planctomycetota bacterium]|nr:response regulator [Planctomycetota bacterium]
MPQSTLTTFPREIQINEIVHVVDDDPQIQNLFRQLGRQEDFAIATYDAAKPFLQTFSDSSQGCLVLDLHLPDNSGLDVLHELASRNSKVPVIFMSGIASVADAVRALKLGSLDFVEKPFPIADMSAAIRRALVADRTRRKQTRDAEACKARIANLTAREFEVMQLVVMGLANKTIASRLDVSPKTVEVHRAHVMQKTMSASLAELVKIAMVAGVTTPPAPVRS